MDKLVVTPTFHIDISSHATPESASAYVIMDNSTLLNSYGMLL